MDCENFEAALMDELYGELDELTSTASKRHAAGCARCSERLAGLAATRRLATIPIVEPPPDLEARILRAAREAARDGQTVVPTRGRLARAVSLAGSWAMRPQTAMAAVFLVMVGTSVLLLTGKASRAPASASITVTEQGSPASQVAPSPAASAAPGPYGAPVAMDKPVPPAYPGALARTDGPRDETPSRAALPQPRSSPAQAAPSPLKDDDGLATNAFGAGMAPPPVAAAPMARASGGDLGRGASASKGASSPIAAAIQSYQAGRYDDATKAFDALAPSDASAELWAARSVRESKGCRAALARFDRTAQRGASSPTGWDALLEGALCYRAIGDFGNARTRLSALLGVDSHKDRARAELDRLNQLQTGQGGAGAGGAAKAAAPTPAAPRASRPAPSAADPGP